MQSPGCQTLTSCDADSDSSHATGSCSPGDCSSVHDLLPPPRAARPPSRRRPRAVSRALFPACSPGSVPPPPAGDERRPAGVGALVSTPLAGAWCPSPLVVDRRAVVPELLVGGGDAYCRLAAAAAAASIYWGRRGVAAADEKSAVELSWHAAAAAAAAAAGLALPTVNCAPTTTTADSAIGVPLLDRSPWLLGLAPPADRLQGDPGKAAAAAATPGGSSGGGSPSSSSSLCVDDDLPLDLSPVSRRVDATSPSPTAVDDNSI